MTDLEQIEYIARRAPELARSGECRDWHHVVTRLKHEGMFLAPLELHSAVIRGRLDLLCDRSRNVKQQG